MSPVIKSGPPAVAFKRFDSLKEYQCYFCSNKTKRCLLELKGGRLLPLCPDCWVLIKVAL